MCASDYDSDDPMYRQDIDVLKKIEEALSRSHVIIRSGAASADLWGYEHIRCPEEWKMLKFVDVTEQPPKFDIWAEFHNGELSLNDPDTAREALQGESFLIVHQGEAIHIRLEDARHTTTIDLPPEFEYFVEAKADAAVFIPIASKRSDEHISMLSRLYDVVVAQHGTRQTDSVRVSNVIDLIERYRHESVYCA